MISTSSKYALRALTVLIASKHSGFMAVETLARLAGLPGPYLAKLIKLLSAKNIVVTKRGLKGGVKIAKRSISFHDVCAALNDPALSFEHSEFKINFESDYSRQFQTLWKKIQEDFMLVLKQNELLVDPVSQGSLVFMSSSSPDQKYESL